MNTCVFPKSSFCSSLYKYQEVQIFKIYIVDFLGNSLLFCSNFSYIIFSLNRLISSFYAKNKFNLFFGNLNLKRFYVLVFDLSLFLNVFKPFENVVNEIYGSFDDNFPYNAYDPRYCA